MLANSRNIFNFKRGCPGHSEPLDGFFCRKGSGIVTTFFNQQLRLNYFERCDSVESLNARHDELMKRVIAETLEEQGQAPCAFTIFVTGSGGRKEQSVWSDQDHGIIYEDERAADYFIDFGRIFSDRLQAAGYVYCEGGIMTSNTQWNRSYHAWKEQLDEWLHQAEWGQIRYTQIFYDARGLYGSEEYLVELKQHILRYIQEHPQMLKRFANNIMHLKPALGPLGQLLSERYGEHQGSLDLKYSAFLPYINSVRLLAMERGVLETSTLERITALEDDDILVGVYDAFEKLLQLRFSYRRPEKYKDTYYVRLKQLSLEERRMLKKILKRAKRLHEEVIARYI